MESLMRAIITENPEIDATELRTQLEKCNTETITQLVDIYINKNY